MKGRYREVVGARLTLIDIETLVALARHPSASMPTIAEILSIDKETAEKRPALLAAKIGTGGGPGLKDRLTKWALQNQTELEIALADSDRAHSRPDEGKSRVPELVYGSEFAGRAGQLSKLRDVIQAVAAGQSRSAVVVGEAGSGKSRLVGEALRYARGLVEVVDDVQRPRLATAIGQCVSLNGGGEALLPLREVLLQLSPLLKSASSSVQLRNFVAVLHLLLPHHFPDGGQSQSGSGDSKSVFYVLRDGLREAADLVPLVIVIEDLHWADIESLEFLHYLTSTLTEGSLGLIMTVRSLDPSASVLPESVRPLMNELETDPKTTIVRVGEEADTGTAFVAEYIRANYEPNEFQQSFVVGLAEVAGDNALFLQELLLDLENRGALVRDGSAWCLKQEIDWTAVPTRIESTLRARIDALDERGRTLAAFGAVQGSRFHSQVLAHALDEDVGALTHELLASLVHQERFVEEDAVVRLWANAELFQFRFVHNLYATLIANRMGPIERTQIHAAVLRSLDRLFPDREPDLEARRLNHAIEAGDTARALELGDYVVGAHLSAGAAKSALSLCERLRVVVSTETKKAWVEVLKAEVLEALGRYAEALELTTTTLGVESTLPKPAQRRLLHVRSMLLRRCGKFDDARETALHLLDVSRDAGETEWACLAARDLGRTEESLAHYDESLRWYVEALACTGGDDRLIAGITEKIGYSSSRKGDVASAEANYEAALTVARAIEDQPLLSSVLLNIGILRMAQSRYKDARDLINQALGVRGAIGLPVPYARAMSNLALVEAFLGDWGPAEKNSDEAVSILRDLEDWHHLAISLDTQGTIALLQGDPETARDRYDLALNMADEHGDVVRCQLTICNLANAAFVRGDESDLSKWIAAFSPIPSDPNDEVFVAILRAEREYLAGRMKTAAKSFQQASTQMRELGDERLALRCERNAVRCGMKTDTAFALSEDATIEADPLPIPRM